MEQDQKTKDNSIHTYAEDMAKFIKDDTGALVKKIIDEEERNKEIKKKTSPEIKKNRFFVYAGLVFLILSLMILSFFFFRKKSETVTLEKQFVPLVFNDEYTYHEVLGKKKEEIAELVLKQINATKVKDGGVEGIYLMEDKQVIGLRRFISLIKSKFIPGDNAFFIKDNFLMGVVKNEVSSISLAHYGFFILLKVSSMNDAFESVHAWEKDMMNDIAPFLGIELSSETSYLFKKNFEDGIIENKNARILYDKDKKLIIMYVFADNNSIVITNAISAAHEIVLRLASSDIKQ